MDVVRGTCGREENAYKVSVGKPEVLGVVEK